MEYKLKEKIKVTKDFLTELENKSWQEIEHLQRQLNNIDTDNKLNKSLYQLFTNLITSYYVFIGGLDNLQNDNMTDFINIDKTKTKDTQTPIETYFFGTPLDKAQTQKPSSFSNESSLEIYNVKEPFEYFTEFDEPVGDPISDEDLYGHVNE